ncbi:MAG TPA: metallophosphatase domain-containing protein [Chitinophagaceae bacterium]|nr:metallophosphatase domain-containing protein [Chitinophagaceae bacterium]
MKFVAISDTHCRHLNLKLPKGDVLLHAGDISYKGERKEMVDFLQWFSKLNYSYKIFIAGNHDFYLEKVKAAELEAMIPKEVIYLNDSGVMIDNIHVWGSPVTPWYYNWAFNRYRGSAIKKHWNLIPGSTDILLTHGPAFGIHDVVVNGNHTGCKDLLQRIEEVKPRVHVCGHIHEGYGSTQKEGTRYVNASVLNESYELVNKPVVFEL